MFESGKTFTTVEDIVDRVLSKLDYEHADDWLLAPYKKPKDRIRKLYQKIDPMIQEEIPQVAHCVGRTII